jgi:hypothetical protein
VVVLGFFVKPGGASNLIEEWCISIVRLERFFKDKSRRCVPLEAPKVEPGGYPHPLPHSVDTL